MSKPPRNRVPTGVSRRTARHPQFRTKLARRMLRQQCAHIRIVREYRHAGFIHRVDLDEERLYGEAMTYVLTFTDRVFVPDPGHPVAATMNVWLGERDLINDRDFVYYSGTWLFKDPNAALEFRIRWSV